MPDAAALTPPSDAFDEAWQAQTLAIADAMVAAGHFSAGDWAEALGAELAAAEAAGKPDTLETYYLAALAALESLSDRAGISRSDQARRQDAWRDAYRTTPHGQPVDLPDRASR